MSKQEEAEYIFAERLLGELVIGDGDYSKEKWEKYKDGFLQSKISFKTWEKYWSANREEVVDKEKKKSPFAIFGIMGQVEEFYNIQPFHYNQSGMFYIWDDENKKYDVCDDVDMLNGISDLGVDTITSKNKTEILNALKQYGRKKQPEEAPLSWVQFKNRVYDWKTDEEFEASPDYLMTNPLPYSPGESEDTPIIDNLFTEWVGKDYKTTLEEIAAYSVCSDQFMQRMIALVGGGSNGKGTFNSFLIRLIGQDNSCSSELMELSSNQFETSVIYKKLLCVMGEVSHGDLKNTNQIKKLAGGDPIRFCFKGKTPFTDDSVTTLISNTNSLPKSPDKTMGFYRKWLIVDFPNQFTEIKHGIIESIPDEEMQNFSRKVLRILKELSKSQKFTNEGTFQERMDRYEERSNPVARFIDVECEEMLGESLELKHFANIFNKYAKENHFGVLSVRQIGKILREEGFETSSRKTDMGDGLKSSSVVILNLSLKTIRTIETIKEYSRYLHGESTENHDSSDGSDGFDTFHEDQEELDFDK